MIQQFRRDWTWSIVEDSEPSYKLAEGLRNEDWKLGDIMFISGVCLHIDQFRVCRNMLWTDALSYEVKY